MCDFFPARTITNVEEHIKNAFISETALSDSSFRHIKIDDDTMEIKRQLDPEILREAALFREQVIIIKTLAILKRSTATFLLFLFPCISVSRDTHNEFTNHGDST
jgi:hypothetical protein